LWQLKIEDKKNDKRVPKLYRLGGFTPGAGEKKKRKKTGKPETRGGGWSVKILKKKTGDPKRAGRSTPLKIRKKKSSWPQPSKWTKEKKKKKGIRGRMEKSDYGRLQTF